MGISATIDGPSLVRETSETPRPYAELLAFVDKAVERNKPGAAWVGEGECKPIKSMVSCWAPRLMGEQLVEIRSMVLHGKMTIEEAHALLNWDGSARYSGTMIE